MKVFALKPQDLSSVPESHTGAMDSGKLSSDHYTPEIKTRFKKKSLQQKRLRNSELGEKHENLEVFFPFRPLSPEKLPSCQLPPLFCFFF